MPQRQAGLWTQENDRRFFFWLFLLGAAFIWVLKEWVGDQFVVTAIPCCLMLG